MNAEFNNDVAVFYSGQIYHQALQGGAGTLRNRRVQQFVLLADKHMPDRRRETGSRIAREILSNFIEPIHVSLNLVALQIQ